ncbi:MAG: RNA methyltransferase [Planctomycetia bacterium]|nr:RNA methyltransferase [Planctomycetia bacterium]
MIPVTSLQNESVKRCVTLRDARNRLTQRRFLIDGARELRRALESGVTITELFVCPTFCKNPEAIALLDTWLPRLESERRIRRELRLYEVTETVFMKLAFGDRTEGFVAVAQMPDLTPGALTRRLSIPSRFPVSPAIRSPTTTLTLPPDTTNADDPGDVEGAGISSEPLLLGVVENVEKPGNLGAILRSADGAGLSGIVSCDSRRSTADLFHAATIRASLGTIFHLPTATASTSETVKWLRETARVRIFAARVEGATPYTEVDLTGPSAIVVGSEADGLTSAWYGDDVTAISLPMNGIADSLNVSVAAAILFYEARRQRTDRAPRRP